MKKQIFFLLCVFLPLSYTLGQKKTDKLTLSAKNTSLGELIKSIESQSNYTFMYNNAEINLDEKITIDKSNTPTEEVLQILFTPRNIKYEISGNQIILTKTTNEAKTNSKKLVNGTVTDQNGEPIIGASVTVKGTKTGTVTNINGNFSVDMSAQSTLVVSYIGYTPAEIKVTSQKQLKIKLEEDAKALNEVVVVGYGSMKRVNLTGALASVGKEVLENKSVPNAIAAIQGTLPGVVVTRGGGQPGAEALDIQVRGKGSASGISVLVIVDGSPGLLSELNPNDIETLTVLKDAASCAIYGSNAAGGVVLVTTKKGKAGKTVVDYSGLYGLTMPSRMPQRISSWEEAEMQNIAAINSGGQAAWTPEQVGWMKGEGLETLNPANPGARWRINPTNANDWEFYDNVNYIEECTRKTSATQTHNVSIKGGNEKNVYMFSLGYYDRQGILKDGPDKNNRYNVRLNLNTEFNKYVSMDTWLAYTKSTILAPAMKVDGDYGMLYNMYQTRSLYSLYNPRGEIYGGFNPLGQMKYGGKEERNNSMLDAKVNIKIKGLVKGLIFNIVASERFGNNKKVLEKRTITYTGPLGTPSSTVNPTNSVEKYAFNSNRNSLQAYATYDFNLNAKHNFSLMGGYAWEEYREEAITAGASSLVTNDLFSLNLGNSVTKTNSDKINSSATMSGFGRLTYNYKEKYLFEANFRYDGSSRLEPNNRWQAFPSLSAAWRISNEDFFSGVNLIQNLKLRASWGQLGNSDAIDYYDYMALMENGSNLPFNNVKSTYIFQKKLPSRKITWETIETSNIGIDFTALNNKLSFSGDYYVKYNNEMLAKLERPSLIGLELPYFNVGELKTWGWEISLGWKDKIRDFQYWVNLNVSDSQNKLMKYDGKRVISSGTNELIEGMAMNTIWGYKTGGLFQTDQEYKDYGVTQNTQTSAGDVKYLNMNDDKVISSGKNTPEDHGDLVKLGEETPRYTFGIDLGFKWKGLDFSAFFQGVGSRDFVVETRAIMPFFENWRYPLAEQRDFWTKDNPNAFWPRPYRGSDHNYKVSDKWVQNAAYIRLKNLQIGYTLPYGLTSKVGMSKVRVFVSGQDLWESTNVFGFIDPEMPNKKDFIYPFYRVLSTGINITF